MKKCLPCNRKDPCITLLHGTSERNIKSIKEKGMKDAYVTTSPFSADYFGGQKLINTRTEKTALIKITTPLSNIYWADWDGYIIKKATKREIQGFDPRISKKLREKYLLIKGNIKPCQITIMPQTTKIRKIHREEKRWKWQE